DVCSSDLIALAVGEAVSAADYRLGAHLISEAGARPEGLVVGIGEAGAGIVASRAVAQEADGAEEVAGARIGQARVEAGNVGVVFAARHEEIPAQAEVERQLAADFPIVLSE